MVVILSFATRRAAALATRPSVRSGLRRFSPSASFTPGSQVAFAQQQQHPGIVSSTDAFAGTTVELSVDQDLATSMMQEMVQELEQTSSFPLGTIATEQQNQQRQVNDDPEKWDFTDPSVYKMTMLPPHEAYTLHPVSYKSEAFFNVEKEKVFGNSWVVVGLVDQLRRPGDTIVADLAGQPIFVVRDKKGDLNGFLNVCRHRGSKLVKKAGRYPVISCPYHRWGYALDGRLLATPLWDTTEGGTRIDKETGLAKEPRKKGKRTLAEREREVMQQAAAEVEAAETAAELSGQMTGAGAGCEQMKGIMNAYSTAHIKAFDKNDFSLFNVRVDTWGPFVFATMSTEIPSLLQCLGDVSSQMSNYPLHELVSVRKKEFQSKSNWKLLAENFMEYYHLPTVHPALTTVSGVDNHHRRQGPGQYIGFVTNPLTAGGQPIDPGILPSMPGLEGEEHMTAVFHHLFPNAFYFILPSHVFTVYITPVSAGYSIEHADLLVHPSLLEDAEVKNETAVLNKKIDDIMAFYDMVNLEDIEACELVQQGVQARSYHGGRVSFRFEETIHRFQNMLIDHMVGKPGRVPKGDESIPFYIGGLPDNEARDSIVVVDELQ